VSRLSAAPCSQSQSASETPKSSFAAIAAGIVKKTNTRHQPYPTTTPRGAADCGTFKKYKKARYGSSEPPKKGPASCSACAGVNDAAASSHADSRGSARARAGRKSGRPKRGAGAPPVCGTVGLVMCGASPTHARSASAAIGGPTMAVMVSISLRVLYSTVLRATPHRGLAARTHYESLGVGARATQAEIKQAYYRLARETHPDARRSPEAGAGEAAAFGELSAAYEALSNPVRRRAYDLQLSSAAAASRLDGAELDARLAHAVKTDRLADALALFLQVHALRPAPIRPENGGALLALCIRRAHMRQAAFVYGRLRDAAILDARARDAWFRACLAHGRADEAMEAFREMEACGVEPSASARAAMRQIRAYAAALADQRVT